MRKTALFSGHLVISFFEPSQVQQILSTIALDGILHSIYLAQALH